MCLDCWQDYGSPQPDGPETMKAVRSVQRLYDIALAGGPAHIVTDDFNVEDGYIDWCLGPKNLTWGCADTTEARRAKVALHRLRQLSVEQRVAALAMVHFDNVPTV